MKFISFILFMLLCFDVHPAIKNINEAVLEFQALPGLKNSSWSLKARNLSSNSEIIDVNSSMSLIPASTLKAITTGVALLEMGSSYTFQTKLAYSGIIEDSILKGDVIIIAGGDPSFGNLDFYDFNILEKWTEKINQLGIVQINGELLVLDTHFSGLLTPSTWVYQDLGNYYGASPASLTYQNNTFPITFAQNPEIGGLTKILDPDGEDFGINLKNEVKSGTRNSGDRAYVYGCPNCEIYSIRGTIPAGLGTFTIKASIPDPAGYFLNQFEKQLLDNDILLNGKKVVRYEYQNAFTILDSHKSIGLNEILRETNVNSNNLYAEHLILEMAKNKALDNPEDVIPYFFDQHLNSEGLFIADGSGLSRYNAITTSNHIELFEHIYNSEHFESYLATFPKGGKEGTIKNMFKQMNGNEYYVKSGTLSRVKAFSGFILNSNKELIAFSFIVNNYDGNSSEISSEMEKVIYSLSD
ncbi:MAG: D-alanyl-D-alanine carboxypeptidase/D-alanyl-D-alanine-endopeptidase [Cytophagales bacterium]